MSTTKIQVKITELEVFDPQDTANDARDEPFFLFYFKNETGGDLTSFSTAERGDVFGKGPGKVRRGRNTLALEGTTYDEMRVEVWEKDGGSYDIKFHEADGTAGSDRRLGTFDIKAVPSGDGYTLRVGGAEYTDYQTSTPVEVEIRRGGTYHYVLKMRFRLSAHTPDTMDF